MVVRYAAFSLFVCVCVGGNCECSHGAHALPGDTVKLGVLLARFFCIFCEWRECLKSVCVFVGWGWVWGCV